MIGACNHKAHTQQQTEIKPVTKPILTGADQLPLYINTLKGKKVALLVNQTSVVNQVHLLDTLLSVGINVVTVFAPEHGFRGKISNGETVKDGMDLKTGIPIISLYGKHKKPNADIMSGIDLVVFDIQDVGARFYTYISSMHYMMEACADSQTAMLILDRPNPNGHIIDGPVLKKHESFVGMHPIPVVHGLTVGELAQMIIGENWLKSDHNLSLQVIPTKNWNHQTPYSLKIPPSPNLPNDQSIALYPSLCFFEGTKISAGRGTDFPFQTYGAPNPELGEFTFTPVSKPLASKYPKFENQLCYGEDLRTVAKPERLDLSYLIRAYNNYPDKADFFNNFFKNLSGNDELQEQIINQVSIEEIRASWANDLTAYRALRQQYLLYND